MIERISVEKLLQYNLKIPYYQRPYKWTTKNISELFDDIKNAIDNKQRFKEYKYRLGTIIVHEDNNVINIVDGQQRIISLILINLFFDKGKQYPIMKNSQFKNKISKNNIKENYNFIVDYFSSLSETEIEKYISAMKDILEVVVITVNNQIEAFQLFDSQNSRGRPLDPHDLLKAYHLREMKEYPYEMKSAVNKWEAVEPDKIKKLFSDYFFPIYNWTNKEKTVNFTANNIDIYKGISENSSYNYARKAYKTTPYFQLAEPFTSGKDFFDMVSHYLELYDNIIDVFNDKEGHFYKILYDVDEKSAGFNYTKNLFYAAVLSYYDRFRNFDRRAVTKIFLWAFMLRLDMERLGYSSINNYAIGDDNSSYSNHIPMFYLIKNARLHNEIANLQIKFPKNIHTKWEKLYEYLKEVCNGRNK